MTRIYFDHNATTPLRPQVLEAMMPFLTSSVGNASSIHGYGREARTAVEAARDILARALGCRPPEVYFTSGGTEADNWAIEGIARSRRGRGRRIVTSSVEHHAVLHTCRHLEQRGYEVIYAPVDAYGVVDLDAVEAAIDEDTVLVSVMHANNETGTVQPLAEIGRLARQKGVPLHLDAVQSFGKLDLRVDELNAGPGFCFRPQDQWPQGHRGALRPQRDGDRALEPRRGPGRRAAHRNRECGRYRRIGTRGAVEAGRREGPGGGGRSAAGPAAAGIAAAGGGCPG